MLALKRVFVTGVILLAIVTMAIGIVAGWALSDEEMRRGAVDAGFFAWGQQPVEGTVVSASASAGELPYVVLRVLSIPGNRTTYVVLNSHTRMNVRLEDLPPESLRGSRCRATGVPWPPYDNPGREVLAARAEIAFKTP